MKIIRAPYSSDAATQNKDERKVEFNKSGNTAPLFRQFTIFIIRLPPIFLRPRVHQHITSTVSNPNANPVGGNTLIFAIPPNIQHHAHLIGISKQRLMKRWYKWRTLTANRQITATKITHSKNTRLFSE